MKILLLVNEERTGDYLKKGLVEAGFAVDLVRDAKDGLHFGITGDYDLVILDVSLPKIYGWQVIAGIRQSGQEMPVLFITARDQVEDRVKGLKFGADDYLLKPFNFSELLVRIRILLSQSRRIYYPELLCVANLELNFFRRQVTRGGQQINLTQKEFALLELFLRRRGEVLPRSMIASQIWDANFESNSNVIEVAIRRLRAKIDDNFEPKLIRTVRGFGYVCEDFKKKISSL